MTRALRDLADRFERLSLRERVLVAAAAAALLLLAWDAALMAPLDREHRRRQAQVEGLRAEVDGLRRSVAALEAQGSVDRDREKRERVAALQDEIAALDRQLAGATLGLIAPREMARVLQQVLARTSKLKLRALRTLPPEPVIAPAAAGTATATPAAAAQIYRHGVEIEVDGTYLEALALLESLEALPWRFLWDRIEYRVETHPRGRLKLVIHTLGLQPGWVGV